jgi:transposase
LDPVGDSVTTLFVKITTSGPRKYVKLVEAFRDERGIARQRVIATLGRLEHIQAGRGDALVNGLLRAAGKPTLEEGTGAVDFAPAVAVGDTWLLHALWHELGFAEALRRLLRRRRREFDAEHLLRVMVFNRLCDPESKLGILRWLEGARVPEVDNAKVTHQHLLRTMDTLNDCADALESVLSRQLRPLIDQELSVVFYDLTTLRTEGLSETAEELRRYGPAKGGGTARQVMLGVVQTAEGLPIHHEVFEGNAAETRTLVPTIQKVLQRYPIQRVVLVADRGLLSLDNLQQIGEIKVGERSLEFILAVPARRYGDFEAILGNFHRTACAEATEEVTGEFQWQGYRLIVAHRPDIAEEQSQRRAAQIAALEEEAARWTGKLNDQDEGKRYRGRKLSDAGVTARFYKAVSDAHLAHLIKVDLSSELFFYAIDDKALARARMLDGKLVLVTNMADHNPEQIVERYKALADIERGFRVLKSEIEIAPVYHRKAKRIRAHALICFLALVLYRVLRMRLKDRHSPYSPERALEMVRRIQFHRVTLHHHQTACGLTTLTPEQRDLFDTIDLPTPALNRL